GYQAAKKLTAKLHRPGRWACPRPERPVLTWRPLLPRPALPQSVLLRPQALPRPRERPESGPRMNPRPRPLR
ncbi:hypothetical protein ACFWN4_03975, partial [Streptomyces sp. NPDC058412]